MEYIQIKLLPKKNRHELSLDISEKIKGFGKKGRKQIDVSEVWVKKALIAVPSKGNSDFKEARKHLRSPVEPSWKALENPMQQTQA